MTAIQSKASNTRTPSNPRRLLPSEFVFVYGTLKRGQPNHRLLKNSGSVFIGVGQSVAPYPLVILGSLPFLLHRPGFGISILGEVYKVNLDVLYGILDVLESHPVFYERKQISVDTIAQRYSSWTYFLNDEHLPACWKDLPMLRSYTFEGKQPSPKEL